MGSPINRTNEIPTKATSPSTPTTCDATYSSQLSLETNPPSDPFNRDAIGRRSMSEKHHAALDAKETGTYQRNKKLREERERERRTRAGAASLGSMESLTNLNGTRTKTNGDLSREALDRVGDLGPSLGLKKSSSLESLQTVIQEMQMSDEPRGPNSLRTPRGRGREEYVRAEMERRKCSIRFPCIRFRLSNINIRNQQNRESIGYLRIMPAQTMAMAVSSIAMAPSKVR